MSSFSSRAAPERSMREHDVHVRLLQFDFRGARCSADPSGCRVAIALLSNPKAPTIFTRASSPFTSMWTESVYTGRAYRYRTSRRVRFRSSRERPAVRQDACDRGSASLGASSLKLCSALWRCLESRRAFDPADPFAQGCNPLTPIVISGLKGAAHLEIRTPM